MVLHDGSVASDQCAIKGIRNSVAEVLSFTTSNYNRFYMQLANILPSNLSVMLLSNNDLRTFFGICIPVIRAMFIKFVKKKSCEGTSFSLLYMLHNYSA